MTVALPPGLGIAGSAGWNRAAIPVGGVPVSIQRDPLGCGPAVVATLSRWLGDAHSQAEVAAATALTPEGITLAEFERLATRFGLTGSWFQVAEGELARLATPFVAHLEGPQGGHFVAVLAMRHGYLVVADPAHGALVGSAPAVLPGFRGRIYLLTESS